MSQQVDSPSRALPGLSTGSARRAPSWSGRHPAQRLHVALSLSFLLIFCGCLLGERAADRILPQVQSTPLPAWDQAFRTADPHWQGADSISSAPLSANRTLWLFGDTWIDPEGTGSRKHAVILRNTIALQEISGDQPGHIRFHWKNGPAGPEEPFPPESDPAWLWPLSGVRMGTFLCLFFIRLVPSENELGFELNGNVLIRIPNPDDPPGQWRQERHEIPFFRHGPNGDSFFGVGCLAQQGFLYVYGVREDWTRGPEGRSLLVARAAAAALDPVDFSAWRFFGARDWSAGVEDAAGQFEGAATEMSVSFLPGRNRFVAVYTSCGLSSRILARFAPTPQGPWGEPTNLWECAEASWGRNYFCYAGKGHPELAVSDSELIITYAANSYDLEDHLNDTRIYWPRFVRVNLTPLDEARNPGKKSDRGQGGRQSLPVQ